MSGKTIEIIEEFDPKKKYNIPVRKQIAKIILICTENLREQGNF
ncbi:hypothetical protein [Nitrosopumilus sp.]